MYPLNFRTFPSRKTCTFSWVIENHKDLTIHSMKGPTFEMNSERWKLELQSCLEGYSFRLHRLVSNCKVVVSATVEVADAKDRVIYKKSETLRYDKTNEPDSSRELIVICNRDTDGDESTGGSDITTESVSAEASDSDISTALDSVSLESDDSTASTGASGSDITTALDSVSSESDDSTASTVSNESYHYPNKRTLRLTLDVCILVSTVENSFGDQELQKRAQDSFAKDTQAMLDNQTDLDVTVILKDGQIKIHKFILVARASPFAKFLKVFPDALDLSPIFPSVAAFRLFLNHLYARIRYDFSNIENRDLKETYEIVDSVWDIARDFDVPDLGELCKTLLTRELIPCRSGGIYSRSLAYQEHKFNDDVFQFIKDHFRECRKEGFMGQEETSPFYPALVERIWKEWRC